MTNNFAVPIMYKDEPYIFCVTDSQATAQVGDTKSIDPKIFRRGNCLLINTGAANVFYEVMSKLDGSPRTCEETADRLLSLSSSFGERENPTTIFVAGTNGDALQMYVVETVNSKETKRGIRPLTGIYLNGSGARQVQPAIQRDFDQGFRAYPKSQLEAMALCMNVGDVAGYNLFVDDRIQFGVVGKNRARVLLHPDVAYSGISDTEQYVSCILGKEFKFGAKCTESESGIRAVFGSTTAFYHALKAQLSRVCSREISCNKGFAEVKAGDKRVADLEPLLAELEKQRSSARPLVDAFVQGSFADMIAAARGFYAEQDKSFDAALEFAK